MLLAWTAVLVLDMVWQQVKVDATLGHLIMGERPLHLCPGGMHVCLISCRSNMHSLGHAVCLWPVNNRYHPIPQLQHSQSHTIALVCSVMYARSMGCSLHHIYNFCVLLSSYRAGLFVSCS